MAEYTYKDVIIDPEDPRVEIGKEYYFGDNVGQLLHGARTGWKAEKLRDVCKSTEEYLPFYNGMSYFSCIIRKEKLSYAERQAKWIADNDVKKGDKVRIARKANSLEDGWQSLWNPDMDEAVGKVGTVSHISANFRECGIEVYVLDVGEFLYPYFVLEKVEQKYVPFDLSNEEDRAKLRGAWVKAKNDSDKHQNVCGVCSQYVYLSCQTEGCTPEDFLERFVFIDGTPCGKLVEVEDAERV